ncbi:putative secretory lipase [Aspergillus novofumigatus IBT 16806]|uniref:Uncharacterized protein n=1 Tax=Aspergillus novofumigatus (strain IBT 16806) TaxID=1392255 RepID=A0A2I1CB76_ASPN1|nr:uncharacterized protein P174DRAFT_458485 [Aspergillus novofumigatus IBT 16806]PKX94872.1 hypothetical protein P174DRAFT_458485 [Aspergillus novofumigatus IBT 16806]
MAIAVSYSVGLPPHPIVAFGFALINFAALFQLLYRSTYSFGGDIAVILTILIPYNVGTTKLLSFQVDEDAADPNCALSGGWDHLGLNATFLANILSGHAVLDNVCVALGLSRFTDISHQATVMLLVYRFAAELQLIARAVQGGTVSRMQLVFVIIKKGVWAGLIPAGLQGLANEYLTFKQTLYDCLVPEKELDFVETKDLCFSGHIAKYKFQDINMYVTEADFIDEPDVAWVLDVNAMGQHVPQIPLFIYKSANNEVSLVKDTDALVAFYCDSGPKVKYLREGLSDHAMMALTANRMDGVPVDDGCTTKTVLTGLTGPRAILGRALLSAPVGTVVG